MDTSWRQPSSLTQRLLQCGSLWPAPSREERAELARLAESLGLIEVEWSWGFPCVDPNNDEDLCLAIDTGCGDWLALPTRSGGPDAAPDLLEDFEDGLVVACEGCGRRHFPQATQRQIMPAARVRLPERRVVSYLAQLVQHIDLQAKQRDPWPVWRLDIGRKEAHVCFLDGSLGSRFELASFAQAEPTVYVLQADRVYGDRFPLEGPHAPLPLHVLAAEGESALEARLKQIVSLGSKPSVAGALPKAYLPLNQPQPRMITKHTGRLEIIIEKSRALVNGTPVLTSRAKTQLPILRLLASAWHKDFNEQRRPDEYRFTRIEALADKLGQNDVESVRRAAKRLGERLAKVAPTAVELVEFEVNRGCRLHPGVVAMSQD